MLERTFGLLSNEVRDEVGLNNCHDVFVDDRHVVSVCIDEDLLASGLSEQLHDQFRDDLFECGTEPCLYLGKLLKQSMHWSRKSEEVATARFKACLLPMFGFDLVHLDANVVKADCRLKRVV